jgi:hypothetical protein
MKTTLKQALAAADLVLFQGLLASHAEIDGMIVVEAHGLDGLQYTVMLIDQQCNVSPNGIVDVTDIEGDDTQLHLFIRMPDMVLTSRVEVQS